MSAFMVKSGTANNAASGEVCKVKNPILERWAGIVAEKPEARAVLTPEGAVARTFAEIEAEANGIAAQLGGLGGGAVVSLQARNSPEWLAMLLGIWKAGGCALLVDAAISESARASVEAKCGARARLGVGGEGVTLEMLENDPVSLGTERVDLIKLTSGTTGEPGAVLFTAAQLEADCDHICATMGIHPEDLNYGVVAFSHSYGFSNLVTPLLCHGVAVVASADPLPRAVLDGVAATRATVLPAVPAIFQAMSALEGEMPALRLCISAGAPLRPQTGAAFHARFGLKVHTFYGASECGGICYDASDGIITQDGFVGRPLQGVTLELHEDGRISVRSPAVGIGELGQPSRNGVFQPADLLETSDSGWRIVGRDSDFINVAGRKVNPADVERALLEHPGIREAVVFGVQDPRREETVCAWVVGSAGRDELLAHCATRLARWQVPREVRFVEAIPVSARGKISRRELRALHEADNPA